MAKGPRTKQIDMATVGALITKNPAGATVEISPGASGTVLTSNGAGAAPSYQASGGSTDPRDIFRFSMMHQLGG